MPRYPAYLNLAQKDWKQRIDKAYQFLGKCQVCPRKCGVNRLKNERARPPRLPPAFELPKASRAGRLGEVGRGFCHLGNQPMVSSFHPHFGEEACLVGQHGSGTIFFTHCNLACVYCQNYDISQLGYGKEVSPERLTEMMIALQKLGCHNINLVTPTSQVPQILASLPSAIQKGLKIPLVYNSNAYDSAETLRLLDGIVDIYMPDAKYSDDKIAIKYSSAPNYFAIMKKAIGKMHRQVGDLIINQDGLAVRGLLIRHLVLPNGLAGTQKIMEFLAKEISANTFVNIMDQYRPCWKANQYPEINRPITFEKYQEARKLAKKAGLKRLYKDY